MLSFFAAATVVTVLQFLRLRERKLLPLLFFFLCLAVAESQDDWYAARRFRLAGGLSGLVLLYVLSPHHHAHRREEPKP
ncbi:MAG TPA: hypothetical protein VJU18_15060 [Vicinamibacteria bacterium]|nr:hypothetical protein [Vicinamibacteria bacterium]